VEVAKRFNPSAGRTLWFADDGSLLTGAEAQRVVAARKGEIYVCRRPPAGGPVEVARVTAEDIDVGVDPPYGQPW
jgi:hypothetical protein